MQGPGCMAPAQLLSTTPDIKNPRETATQHAVLRRSFWVEEKETCISLDRQPCSASPFSHPETRFCDLMEEVASKSRKSLGRFA